jgi:protein-disulfide isomerase
MNYENIARHEESEKIGNVNYRRLALPFCLSIVCLGQATWQTVMDPPGVEWNGLTGARKQSALRLMQSEPCACGCNMKIAECRVKDPTCATSRKLAGTVVKEVGEGKNDEAVRAEVKRVGGEPPPLLEDPVKISLAGDPVRGPENARLTIVEFSDFQCPYCSKAVGEVKEVMKQFPKDVRLVFKQFPLESHSDAEFAAEAALSAQAQGKFWEMHDLLYTGFPNVSKKQIMLYAQQLKLDLNRFNADLNSRKYRARVAAEEQEGEKAGVNGTPSFYFNGRHYNGVFDVASVVPVLKQELK